MTELKGTYRITMVLPAWTVENKLTLISDENGVLGGQLDTLDGHPPVSFTQAKWNKNYFSIDLSVGPGQLRLTGSVDGDNLTGVVVIEETPDSLSGKRLNQ